MFAHKFSEKIIFYTVSVKRQKECPVKHGKAFLFSENLCSMPPAIYKRIENY
jgi:hypothetical protein